MESHVFTHKVYALPSKCNVRGKTPKKYQVPKTATRVAEASTEAAQVEETLQFNS